MSGLPELAVRLAGLDAVTLGHAYPTEVFQQLAKPYAVYLAAAATLRQLDLGEEPGAFVFRPGGLG
jgi:hypothetical protein